MNWKSRSLRRLVGPVWRRSICPADTGQRRDAVLRTLLGPEVWLHWRFAVILLEETLDAPGDA